MFIEAFRTLKSRTMHSNLLVNSPRIRWSMSGLREQLAKAVVLASVQAATRQGRECRVVSFSSANNAMDSGSISCDAGGVRRLLDFLSYSFGGGTDVTGALNYAVSIDSHSLYLNCQPLMEPFGFLS